MKVISNLESSGSNLVFIEEWFDNLPPKAQDAHHGEQYAVRSISISESGKGFTLITEAFMWFVWKSNDEGKFIKAWINEQETGLPIVQVDRNRKCRAILVIDDEQDFVPLQEPKGNRKVKVVDNMEYVKEKFQSPSDKMELPSSPSTPTVPARSKGRNGKTDGTVGEGKLA
jgi:hypothetical protein